MKAMAKQAHTVAMTLAYDERRFGAYRALNYGVSGIVIYHDANPQRAVWCVSLWEEAEAWCSEDRPAPAPLPAPTRRPVQAWKKLTPP